jgi:APA family basic amino acid/polyamine antiporter
VASVPAFGVVNPAALALALLWFFVAVNLFGARAGGGVQVLTTVLKLVPMVVVIVLGVFFAITAPAGFMSQPVQSPSGVQPLLAASTIALFAMLGLESATVPAGKVRDPERTIPRATLVGTLIAGLVYVAISAIPLLVLPQTTVATSSAPFVTLIDHWFGAGSGRWLGLFVVISGLGALNGWTLLTGELTRSMSAQGVMPAVLRRDNARGAPDLALILCGLLASVMVAMNYSKSMVEGFTFLTTVVTAANLPLYLFCALALTRMGGRGQGLRARFIVLGLFGTAYSVIAFVGVGGTPFLWALALAAAGLPVYAWMRMNGASAARTTS